ncbi:MAG: FdtA/QdtA family cupin domain-containing protein [Flavobacteriaceae bacterium]|nr:FdtA/QdtA family cupin domain-containing protein [Flavobacteriaceae bacterium]
MEVEWIDIPNIKDPRGNLAVLENSKLPFDIKRAYYLYDVPSGSERGGHAHKELLQLIIPLSGSFELVLKDGVNQATISLNSPAKGVLIPNMIWRELKNFSAGTVCLVLASEEYIEEDYIREWQDFVLQC